MAALTHTLTSLAAWGGPVNSGSGCLACITHCLRGKTHDFARSGVPYPNCTDGDLPCITASQSGTIVWVDTYWLSGYTGGEGPPGPDGLIVETKTYEAEGTWSSIYGGEKSSTYVRSIRREGAFSSSGSPETTTYPTETDTSTDCDASIAGGPLHSEYNEATRTTTFTQTDTTVIEVDGVQYSRYRQYYMPATGTVQGVLGDAPAPAGGILILERTRTSTGSVVHVASDRETLAQADAVIADKENDTTIWGADKAAQFPSMGCYGPPLFDIDPTLVTYCDLPNPATPLYSHTESGRTVLRARITVSETPFPGQSYSISYDEVVRNLGVNVARSGGGRGRTITSRAQTYTLEDQMLAPDDELGSMVEADSSWAALGYSIVSVPYTPSEPGSAPSSGFNAAGFRRRSRIRFAMRQAGAFTFKIRKVEVNQDGTYTTTLSELTTSMAGTDGTNSTVAVYYAPANHLKEVYLSVDWVRDADENDVTGWLALAQVRDGWAGIRQLDHATLQATSAFYRKLKFTQVSTAASTYVSEGTEDPEVVECYTSLPWLGFTQTQVWERRVGLGGTVSAWDLASASGAGNGYEWSGEVSPFDQPAFGDRTADGWTVTSTSATLTETSDPGAVLNGATWTVWDRITPTANPRYGGNILSITRKTSATLLYDYAAGGGQVREGVQIYLHAATPGKSIQLSNVHVSGV